MEAKYVPEEINLGKYWSVLRRRWLAGITVFAGTSALAAFASSKLPASYQASGQLLFKIDRTSSYTGGDKSNTELESVDTKGSPLYTQGAILKSERVVEHAITALLKDPAMAPKLKGDDGKPVEAEGLVSKLLVMPVSGTDIIEVSMKTDDPQFAAKLINQVMRSYIAQNVMTKREQTLAAREFILSQLPRSESEVDLAAEQLRKFKTQNKIISIKDETTSIIALMGGLDGQINTLQADYVETNSQVQSLREKAGVTSNQAVALNSVSKAPGVQEVLVDLQKAEKDLSVARTVYTDSAEQVKAPARKVEVLRQVLKERIGQVTGNSVTVSRGDLQAGEIKQKLAADLVQAEVKRVGMANKLAAMTQVRDLYRRQASAIPALEKRQQELERKLTASQTTYESLLKNLQEVRIAENKTVGDAQVIQDAKPPTAANTKLQMMLLGGGAFVGLFLGIAAAFFVDLIDRSIKNITEARELFGYTLIGLIPRFEVGNHDAGQEGVSPRILLANSPRSVVQESYQMLRANLKFISSDRTVRTIVVTSSVPGEGKSEVSANLAAAIAQVGRRVLLIDADMRSPSQHHLWGVMNSVGLSNVIVGQENFEQAVQPITNRLSVLTAGVVPPNPLALIDSERMAALIAMFADRYDYIIFDTPPLAGMADAAVLGKMVDGVLLVVQPGVVNTASANAAKSLLARSGPNVLGIVANGVNLKQEDSSYFYYTNDQSYREAEAPSKPWAMAFGRGKDSGNF
jgi:polysaccharide biosynthesis transport protein